MTQIRRFKMETLVRDKMPERMQKLGGHAALRHLETEEHTLHLKLKLREEVEEVCNAATPQDLKEEIADVLEVLYALGKKWGLRWEDIEQKRLQKRDERGGFKRGRFVEFVQVDTPDDSHPIVRYCLENPEKYPEILP